MSKQFICVVNDWALFANSFVMTYDLLPEIELCKNNSFKEIADFYFMSDTF